MTLARLIGTVGGIGYLRPAPGTWGSLAALPLALVLHLDKGGSVADFARQHNTPCTAITKQQNRKRRR